MKKGKHALQLVLERLTLHSHR